MKKVLPLIVIRKNSNIWIKLLLGLTLSSTGCKDEISKTMEKPVFDNNPSEDKAVKNKIVSYNTYKDRLYFYRSFKPQPEFDAELWVKEKTAKDKHQRLFDMFAEIIPSEFRKEIKYFYIFDPKREKPRTFAVIGTQKEHSLEFFSLGVALDLENYTDSTSSSESEEPRINTLGYTIPIYTMIHEFGHYITKNKAQQYLIYNDDNNSYSEAPKKNSFLKRISDTTSWKKMSTCTKNIPEDPSKCQTKECVEKFLKKISQCGETLYRSGEFVTIYAATSLDEDAAETFTHFVLSDEKPQAGTNGAKDKILLFYDDPQMVQIREAIRANLKKKGIHPKA